MQGEDIIRASPPEISTTVSPSGPETFTVSAASTGKTHSPLSPFKITEVWVFIPEYAKKNETITAPSAGIIIK